MTNVEICNIALSRIGERPIVDLLGDDPNSTALRAVYPAARRSVLREYTWSFALRSAVPPPVQAEPDSDFPFVFSTPSGCLKVVSVSVNATLKPGSLTPPNVKYVLRGRRIYTTVPEIRVEYIEDVEDMEQYDDKFVEALSYRLASDIAVQLKQNAELMQRYLQISKQLCHEAAAVSMSEADVVYDDNPYVHAMRSCP